MSVRQHTKVFTVLSFLRMRSPDLIWYQWIYPTGIFVIFFGGSFLVNDAVLALDKDKLIGDINVLMGILVGFYIAALAAISSFSNAILDQTMKGRTPTLQVIRHGKKISEKLTRRRFLAILFGYCATLAIILYVFGVIQSHLTITLPKFPYEELVSQIFGQIAWGAYFWLTSSLLVVTLLGLHYLVERIHRE